MLLASEFWIVVYLAQLLLLSLALGSLALHLPRWLMVPCLSRFLIGFCLTPFVLAVWMLFVSVVLPGSSRWFFLLPPSSVAVVILLRYGCGILRRLGRFYRRCRFRARELWPVYAAYICVGVLIVNVISKLVANGAVPVTGSDALQYLGYSLKFAQTRSVFAVTGFHDSPDGTLIGDIHGPVWHTFLSHALMTTGNNPPGYPYDYAVRVAFQVTVIYMLLAVAALAATSGYWGVPPLSLALLLQVPQFEYISTASSRDGFRIIPLVLLVTILTGLSPRKLACNFHLVALIPVVAIAAFSLAGHTLGGIVAITIGLAWSIWVLAAKAKWIKVVLVLMAMGVGFVLAGPQYIQAYLEIGRVPGAGVFREMAIAGTPMHEAWSNWLTSRMGGTASAIQRLSVLLARDQYRLSVFGLLGSVCAVLLWPKFRRQKQASIIIFIGLVTLVVAIPFTGLFDIGFGLSDWFVRNFRYPLHWYPFAAVCVAMLLGYGYDRLMSRSNKYLRVLAGVAMVGVTLAASFLAHNIIVSKWRTNGGAEEEWLMAIVKPLKSVLQQMPAGKRLLLDNESYNYYLDNQAIVMFSRPTWDILQAKDENQAWNALKALNIGAVGLRFAEHTGYWKDMPLLDLLTNPNRAKLISVLPKLSLKIYILNDEMPNHQRRALEGFLKTAPGSLRSLWSFQSLLRTKNGNQVVTTTAAQQARLEGASRLMDGPFPGIKAICIEGIAPPLACVYISKIAAHGGNFLNPHLALFPRSVRGQDRKKCVLGQNVNIGNNVVIGNYVKIQNNVSVYEGVTLEDYAFCGTSMVFTNIADPRSKYPQVGAAFYKKTLVKEGASLGANSTIVCGHTIGRFAFVGAGAVVTKDIPDYALVVGNPARIAGWMSEAGQKLAFDKDGLAFCPKSNKHYRLENSLVREIG